jgi:hypothetical protein
LRFVLVKNKPARREETAMAKGQLIVALDFSGIAEDEFHDWFG